MARQIGQSFEKFQQSRREFVQSIVEYAGKPENVPRLMELNVLSLLHPLLLDPVPSIQQNAALALGKLANYSQQIAEQITEVGILPQIVNGLSSSENHYKKNACFVVRTISKHSATLAQSTVDAGALLPLVQCLESSDVKVCEAAAWAIGFIASHSVELAQAVVDQKAIPHLIVSVKHPDQDLKRLAVGSLGDIASHTPELAKALIEGEAIPNIAPLLRVADPKLRQVVCSTLAHIAKHSVESADLVIAGGIFPEALNCLKDREPGVRKAAAALVRELAKHTQEQAQTIIGNGGAAALVQYLKPEMENDPLNAVMAIGYISSFSQSLAMALIDKEAPEYCIKAFIASKQPTVKAATAWALGQLGKHSPEHASRLTKQNVLDLLLDAHLEENEELKLKTKRALKLIVEKTTEIEALQTLISRAPDNILSYVLEQIAKLLPKNPKARVPFVTSGGFQAVQKIEAPAGSKIREYIDAINNCYPDQAVRYYSPQYAESLKQEIEGYNA